MKKILLIIAVLFCIGFTSCTDKEERDKECIEALIDTYMFNNLPSYPNYTAIETIIEDEWYDYNTDEVLIDCGRQLVLLDKKKSANGWNKEEQQQWLGIMDSIRIMVNTIDTNKQKGYFITHKYRCTNNRGIYEIKIVNFHVNLNKDSIYLHHFNNDYDDMIQDVYLASAIEMLKDDEFANYVKNRGVVKKFDYHSN